MRKRKTSRTWRGIVRRRKDQNAAEHRKQRSRRRERRRQAFATMTWRLKAVRDDRARRATDPEHIAAKQTAQRFGVSVTTIRRWEKNHREHGKRGLLDKVSDKGGRRPQVSFEIISFVLLLRTLCGWGAIRIAAELVNKGIAQISHQTVHRMFVKYHLPTKTYHPKGKSFVSAIAAIANGHPMSYGTSISRAHFSSSPRRCTYGLSWTMTPVSPSL